METYFGYVRTPSDAIKLFEACRLGLLPRVQRRLSEKERQSIRSGSVFVWDEREAGMRRWTDGKSWSASRVSGSFLTYREMEGKRSAGFGSGRKSTGKTPESRASDEDQDDGEPEGYRYKADGLMKQSFSITTNVGQHLHLISYYSRPHPGAPEMLQPTNDPQLRNIIPPKNMYPESSMGETSQVPALTRVPMQTPYNPTPGPTPGYPPHQLAPHHVAAHQQQQQPPTSQPHPQQQQQQPHQAGYGWPPSPVATPPYNHYTASPYQNIQPAPSHTSVPHPASHQYGPPPPSTFDRLPPLVGAQKQSPSFSPSSRRIDEPQLSSPPNHYAHSHVLAEPRNIASQRQSPNMAPSLPPISAVSGSAIPSHMQTPPNRALSVSPSRSMTGDLPSTAASTGSQKTSNLASLLLHPSPGASEAANMRPIVGCGTSGGSPKSGLNFSERGPSLSEDMRTLQVLNRNFCT